MDDNLKKIYTEKKSLIKTVEIPILSEIPIMDSEDDIEKITQTFCTPYLSFKSQNGTSLSFEASAAFTVMYEGNENVLSSAYLKYGFSKTIEDNELGEISFIKLNAKSVSARQIGKRKIEVKATVVALISTLKVTENEINFDFDEPKIETNIISVPASTTINVKEKSVTVSENLYLPAGMPEIKCILRYFSSVSVNESKFISDKTIVKGLINCDILYKSENNDIVKFKDAIPFSQVVDTKTDLPSCSSNCKACLGSFVIMPESSNDGSKTIFAVDATVNLTVSTFCEENIPLCLDAYSVENNIETEKMTVSAKKKNEELSEKVLIKKQLDIKDNKVFSVIDSAVNPIVENITFNNNEMLVTGSLNVGLLYKSENGDIKTLNESFQFEYKRQLSNIKGTYSAEVNAMLIDSVYTILSDGSKIDLQTSLLITADIFEENSVQCIKNINLLDKLNENKSSITLYYPESNENLWDIGKKFAVKKSSLLFANELTDDNIQSKNMLIIPEN